MTETWAGGCSFTGERAREVGALFRFRTDNPQWLANPILPLSMTTVESLRTEALPEAGLRNIQIEQTTAITTCPVLPEKPLFQQGSQSPATPNPTPPHQCPCPTVVGGSILSLTRLSAVRHVNSDGLLGILSAGNGKGDILYFAFGELTVLEPGWFCARGTGFWA